MRIAICAGQPVEKHHIQEIRRISKKLEIDVVSSLSLAPDDSEVLLTSTFADFSLTKFPKLRWVHVTSAGVNAVPKEIYSSNVLLTNSSGVHPVPISEHIFAYLLMFARQLNVLYREQLLEKQWSRKPLNVFELKDKTIGIIGMGRIGERTAELAKAFEMKVLGIDRKNMKSSFATVLRSSDFVINCLPSTKETIHLFGKKEFSCMKPTSYFINIGRGDVVDEKALIEAVNTKQIAGAGLDVFEEEPLPSSSHLWKFKNVIITPHTAGWTPRYMDRVIDIFTKNLKGYLKKTTMPTLVNKKLGY